MISQLRQGDSVNPSGEFRTGAAAASGDTWALDPSERDATVPGPEAVVLRVLVVEDLPRVQALLCELIDDPGRCEVLSVADTEAQAIEDYDRLRPHAVIIDLSLRQGTGLGVITQLRRRQEQHRSLLIVLTNHTMPVLEVACRSAGADHFLDKSRDFPKVRPLLEQAPRALAGAA